MNLKTFWYTIFYGLAVYCCSTQSTLSKSNKQKTEQVKETNDEAFDESGSVLQEEVERYEYEPLSHSAKMPVDVSFCFYETTRFWILFFLLIKKAEEGFRRLLTPSNPFR